MARCATTTPVTQGRGVSSGVQVGEEGWAVAASVGMVLTVVLRYCTSRSPLPVLLIRHWSQPGW